MEDTGMQVVMFKSSATGR